MSGAYRIEVSPNNRAGCKNTECKREGIKIPKGQLRYGTFITGPEWQNWAWKHWGCVTPKQISNLKKDIEGEPSQLDGYDELPEDLQEKVAKAIEQGHVADEDWGWDIEMNREGKTGYLTLESKRRLKAEAQALKEEVAGEGSASTSKTDTKKRGHVKDDSDAEGLAENEPPAKKTKARTKKEPKIKNEDANGGSKNEGLTVKKTKPKIKKESKIKNEDAETRSENEGPANKKTKAAIKKRKKTNGDEVDEEFEQDAQPKKKGRKQAKKATPRDEAASHIKEESSGYDALPPPIAKRARAPRKAAMAKKIKDEDTEIDGLDLASELETPVGNVKPEYTSELEAEASEDAPKLQKGRKKAPNKSVKGTAEGNKKEDKPKGISAGPRTSGRVTRSHQA